MSDVVEVWQIPLRVPESTLSQYFTCLSQDEKSRANRFKFIDDKRRYVVARGTLRYLLSAQFDRAPSEIAFCYGKYGKPALDTAANFTAQAATSVQSCDFHFNLSHSGELALCALGHQRKVGVDIERLKPIKRLDGMMERCLSATELVQVQSLPVDAQLRAFLQRWTCKEAYLKAIGLGLIQSMQTVEVEIAPPRLVCVPEDCEEGWHLSAASVPKNYVGAVVVAGWADLRMCQWTHL